MSEFIHEELGVQQKEGVTDAEYVDQQVKMNRKEFN